MMAMQRRTLRIFAALTVGESYVPPSQVLIGVVWFSIEGAAHPHRPFIEHMRIDLRGLYIFVAE